jgi:hypothetical protein
VLDVAGLAVGRCGRLQRGDGFRVLAPLGVECPKCCGVFLTDRLQLVAQSRRLLVGRLDPLVAMACLLARQV